METYISELQSSTIALPAWGVVIFWLIIFASAQVLFRTARSFSQAQDFVVTGGPPQLVREQSLGLSLVQVSIAAAIFAFASFFAVLYSYFLLADGSSHPRYLSL